MEQSDIIKTIRQEVAKALNVILAGVAGPNAIDSETIQNLFPGMPDIPTRPVMHPYGHVSRAANGTASIVAKMGDHVGNRIVIGHRDKARPSVDEGETMLYNSSGEQIYIKHGDIIFTGPKIHIGSSAAAEPFVLGLVFQSFANQLLQLIEEHTHVTSAPGSATSPPINQTDFENLRQDPISNSAILSDKIFGEKG